MEFRPPTADEFQFIFDSWARSFKHSPYAGIILNKDYQSVARSSMNEIVDRGARVIVAVSQIEEDGITKDRIAGYVVFEPADKILHWVYVRDKQRGMMLGTRLVAAATKAPQPMDGWRYTYRTKASAKFLGPRFLWDPSLARIKR